MRDVSLLAASAAAPLTSLIFTLPLADAAATYQRGEINLRAGAGNGSVPNGAAEAAIEAMNKGYYNQTDGRWDSVDAWWLSGVALQAVVDYMLVTDTQEYLQQAEHTVELQKAPLDWWPEGGGYFRADSTDDTGWWALAMVGLYDLTGSPDYLHIARLDEEYVYKYWNASTCGGGVIWDVDNLEYKNAISNELYLKLAASLHNRIPGDKKYLEHALQTWTWFRNSGMINPDSLVNDGLDEATNGTCTNNGGDTWTYNQGVILGGLTELYHATNDEEYLTVARDIADAVLASETLSPNGILTEPCDPEEGCDHDQTAFKGTFAKNLAELNGVLNGSPYKDYLTQNAESAYQYARNGSDFYDVPWAGPFNESTIGSQASAVGLLVSVLGL